MTANVQRWRIGDATLTVRFRQPAGTRAHHFRRIDGDVQGGSDFRHAKGLARHEVVPLLQSPLLVPGKPVGADADDLIVRVTGLWRLFVGRLGKQAELNTMFSNPVDVTAAA